MKQENFLPIVDDWPRAGHVTKFWPMNRESLLLDFLGRSLLLDTDGKWGSLTFLPALKVII